jgi:3-oxoacyl-[acyl-carrier-protein] synthase-1
VIAAALVACQKGYTKGPNVLAHWANDAGQRAALTMHYQVAA